MSIKLRPTDFTRSLLCADVSVSSIAQHLLRPFLKLMFPPLSDGIVSPFLAKTCYVSVDCTQEEADTRIYTIIPLKSVGVSKLQVAILAPSSQEMYQTVRID